MKNQTEYRLILSDKSKVVIVAANAGEAIETALRKNRNREVLECYSGMTESDCEIARQIDSSRRCMPGIVSYEVPYHVAYGAAEQLMNPRARKVDGTEQMFPGEEFAGRLSD